MVHFDRVAKYVKSCVPARARGTAYRLPVGYPVFLDEGHDGVEGQVLELEAPTVLLALLDEFHGVMPTHPAKSLFHKKEIDVETAGTVKKVFAYVVNPSKLPRTAKPIENGDWRSELDRAPAVTSTLTERQTEYVRRLGSSTGREIVPINLELYRELMKLDLIVDKGRRLALSKLGRDVYRYLS
ncbi:MAG: gamma-glutamylcyclotransferase [Bdellovibrionales bacterium]|nr:gamma-glutamylcyclotransferase [Bdellovibrionales bacterium]